VFLERAHALHPGAVRALLVGHEVVRVVGERWSPRTHAVRDALARNTVPLGFYPVDSAEGRRLLEATPGSEVRVQTCVVDGRGAHRLEGLVLEDGRTGEREEVPAAAVFVLIGAEPRTDWRRVSSSDERGFIPTGRRAAERAARAEAASAPVRLVITMPRLKPVLASGTHKG
jgi:hypothetical protein